MENTLFAREKGRRRARKGGHEGSYKKAALVTHKKGDVRACSVITCCVIYMGPGFLQEHIFLH